MALDASGCGPFTGHDGPVIVGHRGAGRGVSPAGHRENTIASFLEAVDAGAAWVELDVQATADGVLLLAHNVGTGTPISVQPLASLIDRGLETLDAVHAALPPWVGIDVDLKVGLPDPSGIDITVESTLTWLAARATERPWAVTSSDATVVALARAHGLDAGWISIAGWCLHEALATAARSGATVMAANARPFVDPIPDVPDVATVMAAADRLGIQVLAWGAQPEDVAILRAAGVAAVCADDVAGCVAALGAEQPLAA